MDSLTHEAPREAAGGLFTRSSFIVPTAYPAPRGFLTTNAASTRAVGRTIRINMIREPPAS